MKVLSGSEVYKRLEGAVQEGAQVEERGVGLTAGSILRLETASRLDLGGGEYEAGSRSELAREKKDPQDDHGWWLLEEGTYLLRLNEGILLPAGAIGFLAPHPRLLEGGASHPTLCLPGTRQPHHPILPLSVPDRGIAIEENAIVSWLVVVG